jgi:hypothetical protein
LGFSPNENEDAHGEKQDCEADYFYDSKNFVGIVFRGEHREGDGD